jgi:hypothetical protein
VVEPWLDRGIVTEPSGFEPSRMPWPLGYLALPLRRSLNARWFQTFLTIEPDAGPRQTEALDLRFTGTAYVAVFTARASGRVHLWVNDAVLPFLGLTDHFYANNRGTAEVVISQLH